MRWCRESSAARVRLLTPTTFLIAATDAQARVREFNQFSPLHAAVVLAFAGCVAALVVWRRALRDERSRDRFDRMLAALALVAWLVVNGWWFLPSKFDLQFSLPLHVCDLAGVVVPIALATRLRWARAIAYYWGLGLSSQGLITPDLRDGPWHVGFWVFWINHFVVIGLPLYDIAARGYRPAWRDFAIGFLGAVAYVALIVPLDLLLGVNYGYVGPSKPNQPSLIDYLGPWPWRVFVMIAIGAAVMALMTLPFEAARRRQHAREGQTPARLSSPKSARLSSPKSAEPRPQR
jgi:hypothetical integral membrane protein (TIGR02206 family)